MFMIRFTFPEGWSEYPLVSRINEIVYGSGLPARKIDADKKWTLGGQNDWWVRFDDGHVTISNRGEERHNMEALATILRRYVDLKDATVESI